jgi:hypothetical protein
VDIVIVDSKSDLNVYVDMARDTQAEKRAPLECCASLAGKVVPSIKETKSYCTNDNAAGACGSEANDNTKACWDDSCCKREESVDHIGAGKHGVVADEYDLPDVNINEWAGEYLHSPFRLILILSRVIQNFRYQELTSIQKLPIYLSRALA